MPEKKLRTRARCDVPEAEVLEVERSDGAVLDGHFDRLARTVVRDRHCLFPATSKTTFL
jgi:hypothetical protein